MYAFIGVGSLVSLLVIGWLIKVRITKNPSAIRAALIEQRSGFRPFVPRLVGGFSYAAVDPGQIRPSSSVRKSLRQVLSREQSVLSPQQLADVAVLNLWYGRLGEPIQLLEEIVARFPESSDSLNDLAVAYMARSEAESRPFDDLRALGLLDKAVAQGRSVPEVLFNRALALQRLCLMERAKRAWKLYQESETDERWKLEAGRRAEGINAYSGQGSLFDSEDLDRALGEADTRKAQAIIAAHPQAARRFLEEEKLVHWAKFYLEGRLPESGKALREAGLAASLVVGFARDLFLADAVQGLESGIPEELHAAAVGLQEYSIGRKLYAQGDYSGALVRFKGAEESLGRAKSPFALRASYNHANCNHYLSRRSIALKSYAALAARAEAASYRSLLGEILWMKGLSFFVDRNVDPARESYAEALEAFGQTGEIENIAGAHILLAETFDHQGDPDQAWRHRLAALAAIRRVGDAQRRYQVYSVAAIAASRSDFPEIALYFQEAALEDARRLESPLGLAQALFWKAKYEFQGGDREAAARDLGHAGAALLSLPPSAIKDRTEAEILLVKARLLASEAPQSAVEHLDRAIELYARGGHRTNLIEMLIARAEALSKLGRLVEAEHDLETAAGWIESWRLHFKEPAERTLFMEQWRSLFEAIVRLQLEDQGDPEAAFASVEKARAKTLLERLGGDPLQIGHSGALCETCEALPEHTIVVSYFKSGPRLMAFVIGREGVLQAAPLPEKWHKIEEAISAFRAGLEGHAGLEELNGQAERLYEVLITPLGAKLKRGAHLVVNPDGLLYKLPFAALRNPQTGSYLVEAHPLTISPSAGAYLECLTRYRALERERGKIEKVLTIKSTRFDGGRFPELSGLEGAEDETRGVKSLYPNAVEMSGEDATIDGFLLQVKGVDVVHFSGHAGAAQDAFLLFARDRKGGDGVLRASQIEGLQLSGIRIVVLAACETGEGQISQGEGIDSLGRAFMAAGVPAVVETKWKLDDSGAVPLILEFYRQLQVKSNPALAFHAAQLSLLNRGERDRDDLRVWAGVQFAGGSY